MVSDHRRPFKCVAALLRRLGLRSCNLTQSAKHNASVISRRSNRLTKQRPIRAEAWLSHVQKKMFKKIKLYDIFFNKAALA